MWTLRELESQENGERRWSTGEWGPRVYLTCDKDTALLIVRAVNVELDAAERRVRAEFPVYYDAQGREHGEY